jgi:hypothetical protein
MIGKTPKKKGKYNIASQTKFQIGNKPVTEEEYKGYLGRKGGKVTPQVEQIRASEIQKQKEVRKAQIEAEERTKVEEEQIRKDVQEKITAEKVAEHQKEFEEAELPSFELLKKAEELKNPPREVELSKEIEEDLAKQSGFTKAVIPESVRFNLAAVGKATEETLSPKGLIEVWDITKNALTRKKPLKYVNAKEGLDAKIADIRLKIENARAGTPYNEALDDIRNTLSDLNRMRLATHDLGKLNVNYLIDDGISIEAEIATSEGKLRDAFDDINLIRRKQLLESLGLKE